MYTDISHNLKPSGELPMHFGLQQKINTEVRVILHFHPTYTVAAMYAGIQLPVLPPISQELADSCIDALGYNKDSGDITYNIVGMDRHGVIAVDTTPWRAYEHIERLEHICKIVLASGKY
jgi:L-fuculose-phosphate aldolase